MVDIYDFNAAAGSIHFDARVATTFRGQASGNLTVGFSNFSENDVRYVKVSPGGFAITISATFPVGTTFSTSVDTFVRVTQISGTLVGEVLLP